MFVVARGVDVALARRSAMPEPTKQKIVVLLVDDVADVGAGVCHTLRSACRCADREFYAVKHRTEAHLFEFVREAD